MKKKYSAALLITIGSLVLLGLGCLPTTSTNQVANSAATTIKFDPTGSTAINTNTAVTGETYCANRYAKADQTAANYTATDPEIAEYLAVWKKLLLNSVSQDLVDQHFYITNAEIIDAPDSSYHPGKYFEVNYYIDNGWMIYEDRAGFSIVDDNKQPIEPADIEDHYAKFAENEIFFAWEYDMSILKHERGGFNLSDFVAVIESGAPVQSCEDIIAVAEAACPEIKNKQFNSEGNGGAYVSFRGEIDKTQNKCGYGSVQIATKQVSCNETPCGIN